MSQNKTPGDSEVTSFLGFSSKNVLEWYFNVVKKNKINKNINLRRKYGIFKFKNTPKIN